MEFSINAVFEAVSSTKVNLPIKSWDEVQAYFIKWDTLHYTLDGETWQEVDLEPCVPEDIDTKRPARTEVWGLASQGPKLVDEEEGW